MCMACAVRCVLMVSPLLRMCYVHVPAAPSCGAHRMQEMCKQAAESDTSGTMNLMRQRQQETGSAHVILSSSQFLAYVLRTRASLEC